MTARYEHTTDGPARGSLRLLQLYPRDMNIYGDWGNTLVLARRAQWQGYDVELLSYDPGDELPSDVDILVGGGGQDSGQDRIKEDLVKVGPALKAWAADGVPMRVPGAFELINASARLKAEDYDAIIAIGCVVRGDTPHFDYICQGVTQGLALLNAETKPSTAPVIFGVLTTETMEQAEDRAGGKLGNKGAEAAETALKMCRPICVIGK